MAHTLVCFHAHPDDEALLTAGTMARAAAEGHRVVLVVATAGEEGRVGDGMLAAGESLGERRRTELERSAAALGVARLELLGYRDSGLEASAAGAGTFVATPVAEAAERLAAILAEEHADVLTTYDPRGGYGHPDHVRVHEVGAAAALIAGTPVVLEATVDRDLMQMGLQLASGMGFEVPPDFAPDTFDSWFTPNAELTTLIDVSAYLDAKRASMEAHTSQASGAGAEAVRAADGSNVRTLEAFLSLPPDLFALAFSIEWYVRRGATPGTREESVFAAVPPALGRPVGEPAE